MGDLESFDIKKIYTETESLIWSMYNQKRLNEQERDFLWNILEMLKNKQIPADLFTLLLQWLDKNTGSSDDQIIKATLLAMDMDDQEALAFNLELVRELLQKSS
ncbi:MAG: hypothetical protein PHC92_07845 [Syntrophomonadaceae bacterium]|nr:hypothetical protein [Syntrophomonadaceae bacterium]MDD3023108.1 hypothetical protein [Syntrophomonadaceae bacterium]